MKILHVSYADTEGGAAIAAFRLHRALVAAGVESRMAVVRKCSDDPTVESPLGRAGLARHFGAHYVARQLLRLQTGVEPGLRSVNCTPSGLARHLNRSEADIVHLHWVGLETMSVAEIGRIRKPVAWTFHDMWAFCGAEHYEGLQSPNRFRASYRSGSRAEGAGGLDLDRWTWRRKVRQWRDQEFHIVCPSRWMARCAGESALMSKRECSVIPYAIDMAVFRPHDRKLARSVFGLPRDCRLVLFGAQDSTSDPRKGYDLLQSALGVLSGPLQRSGGVALAVFGASSQAEGSETVAGLPAYFMGRLRDPQSLALLYSAADVFVAPSRQDNLPNTVLEALACGTPCVGFDIGGMGDLIETGRTGLLAPAFDVNVLSRAIEEVLGWDGEAARTRCRAFAEERFEAKLVAAQHIKLYDRLIAR